MAKTMNAKTMTIYELLDAKQAQESELYMQAFDLAASAGAAIAETEYEGIASALGNGEARKVRANDMHAHAMELRNELLADSLRVNADFDRAKVRRQELLEEALDPQDVTVRELQEASKSTEEELTSLADIALSVKNEDGVLLALRAARQQGKEITEAHIRTVRPDLGEIAAELDTIEELPEFDEDDLEVKFDSIAQDVPSREDFLRSIL